MSKTKKWSKPKGKPKIKPTQLVWVIKAKEPDYNIRHISGFSDKKLFEKNLKRIKQKKWRDIKVDIMTKKEFDNL